MAPKEKPKAAPSPHLYELGEEWLALDALLFETGGELTPEVEEKLKALDLQTADKVDGYYHYLSGQNARVAALKEEAKKLTDRARIISNGLDKLKGYVLSVMQMAKRESFAGKVHVMKRVKNGGQESVVLLVAEAEVPKEFTREVPATYAVDRDSLRAVLNEAKELERRKAAGEEPPAKTQFTDEQRAAALKVAKLESTGYRLGME